MHSMNLFFDQKVQKYVSRSINGHLLYFIYYYTLYYRAISEVDLRKASGLLQISMSRYVALYNDCPPNMHIACHLPDTIRRFGPAHV